MYVILTIKIYVHYNVHMNTKTTLPISQARKKIFDIAEEVQKPDTYYTLTERGLPKAVIMSAEEFESWQETLEVIQDFPHLKKEIKIAEKEYEKGNYVILREFLAKNEYVPRHHSPKSSKGAGKSRK